MCGSAPCSSTRSISNSWLETGTIDFAMGSFPHLTKGIRRQPLWTERYVSVVRKGHPRLAPSRR